MENTIACSFNRLILYNYIVVGLLWLIQLQIIAELMEVESSCIIYFSHWLEFVRTARLWGFRQGTNCCDCNKSII